VTVTADAIADVVAGRFSGEGMITKAIRAGRPDVRAIAVDLDRIRWTDPKTDLRVTFDTPAIVRGALLALSWDRSPQPFWFHLGPTARVSRDYFDRDSRV
jgi:hypothetical protein